MKPWTTFAVWSELPGRFTRVCFTATAACGSAMAASTVNDFSGAEDQTPFAVLSMQAAATNVLAGGALRLPATNGMNALVLFDRTATGACRRIVAELNWICPNTAQGFAYHLLNTSHFGTTGAGGINPGLSAVYLPEPAFTNSLSIAFDTADSDDYQNLGPHEVSLHWNGGERANRRTAADFRTGALLPVRVEAEFVAGGAEVSVWINGSAVYSHYFLAGVLPYESRVALSGWFSSTLPSWVDDLNVRFEEPGISFPAPVVVHTFSREWINATNQTPTRTFALPADGQSYARIVAAVTLALPTGTTDPYDRKLNLCVFDDAGRCIEIARFITPFKKAWTWYADVTDYQRLLRGPQVVQLFLGTYSASAYLVSVDLIYYPGRPKWEAFKVENLWQGEPLYGDTNNPISNFFTPRTVTLDPVVERAKLHFMVTGHGSANTDEGAEFLKRGRTVTVNGTSFTNLLWKDDCYLNPCRPQNGTWKDARAGWAPGDRVEPWELDITDLVTPGQSVTIEYVTDDYINYAPVPGDSARHWVESQLISYRTPPPLLVLERCGGDLVLTWTDGNLQSASDVTGPYADVVGAVSPWTNAPVADCRFFRLRK